MNELIVIIQILRLCLDGRIWKRNFKFIITNLPIKSISQIKSIDPKQLLITKTSAYGLWVLDLEALEKPKSQLPRTSPYRLYKPPSVFLSSQICLTNRREREAMSSTANLEDVHSVDLMSELLRRMKCEPKPDKRLILVGKFVFAFWIFALPCSLYGFRVFVVLDENLWEL